MVGAAQEFFDHVLAQRMGKEVAYCYRRNRQCSHSTGIRAQEVLASYGGGDRGLEILLCKCGLHGHDEVR